MAEWQNNGAILGLFPSLDNTETTHLTFFALKLVISLVLYGFEV